MCAGLVLAAAGAKVQVSVQQEVKLKTVKRSCEQMEGAQMVQHSLDAV